MDKSEYQFLLEESLIAKVDALAKQSSLSRSEIISDILEEYFSEVSSFSGGPPLAQAVKNGLSGNENFSIEYVPGENRLRLKSSLKYKYRPSLRYSLSFTDEPGKIGALVLSIRDNDIDTLRLFHQFFANWADIETHYANSSFIDARLEEGRFTRILISPQNQKELSSDALAKAISEYITSMDRALKLYFTAASPKRAVLEQYYRDFIRLGIIF